MSDALRSRLEALKQRSEEAWNDDEIWPLAKVELPVLIGWVETALGALEEVEREGDLREVSDEEFRITTITRVSSLLSQLRALGLSRTDS